MPPLRSGTKLAFACSETSSHSAMLRVELEQPPKEEKLHTNIATYRWCGQPRGLNRTDTALSRGTAG